MALKTSIYITDGTISAVVGNDKGKRVVSRQRCSGPLPPGLVVQGVIQDTVGLGEAVDAFIKENSLPRKGVQLIIDPESFLSRTMEVPLLPEKKLMAVVSNSFNEQKTGYGELLYDYLVMNPRMESGAGQILACAVEKELVASYLNVFASIGISLENIDLSLSCALRLCLRIPVFQESVAILAILDGPVMVSLLFDRGIFRFTTRTRLLEERETPAFAVEISRNLSSLVQFNITQGNVAVDAAYICGMRGDEVSYCADISDSLGIAVEPELPGASGNVEFSDYFYCLGDLIER